MGEVCFQSFRDENLSRYDEYKFVAVLKLIVEAYIHKRFSQKSLEDLRSYIGFSWEFNW